MNGSWSRNAFVYLLILVAAAALFLNIYGPGEEPQTKSLSEIAALINRGEVTQIDVQEEELRVTIRGVEQPLVSRKEEGTPFTRTLQGLGVDQAKLADVKINVLSYGRDLSAVLHPQFPATAVTLTELQRGAGKAWLANIGATRLALASTDAQIRVRTNNRIGAAVDFIIATPFMLAEEGR